MSIFSFPQVYILCIDISFAKHSV